MMPVMLLLFRMMRSLLESPDRALTRERGNGARQIRVRAGRGGGRSSRITAMVKERHFKSCRTKQKEQESENGERTSSEDKKKERIAQLKASCIALCSQVGK